MGQDSVALVKAGLPLSQLVGRYVTLVRKGNRLAACCPFHGEKTPSFYVDDGKGVFHCFGCGKGGDLLSFAMEMERLPFGEALEFLAELAGVELPERRSAGPGREQQQALLAIHEEAKSWFQKQLRRSPEAQAYLQSRQVDLRCAELFALGWAGSDWEGLSEALSARYPRELLLESGLVKEGRTGVFDLFRERLIFPIHDAGGRVLAFGGRRIDGEQPKYINSPETPIYSKGHHVYNLNLAKPYLKKQPELVIVEGYMDALRLYQAGFGQVVASLGTAFTSDQARLIKRLTSKVILNFDGDAAGFKAARASIEALLPLGMNLRVVSLPARMDPDDFIRARGAEAYRDMLDEAPDFFTFLTEWYASQGSPEDPSHVSFVVREIGQLLGLIGDAIVREHYLERLALHARLSLELVRRVLDGEKGKASPRSSAPAVRQATPWRNKIEQEFLFLVLHFPHWAQELPEAQGALLAQLTQHLFADRPELLDLVHASSPDLNEALAPLAEEERMELRALYFSSEYSCDAGRLTILIPDLTRQMIRMRIEANNQALAACDLGDQARKRSLWEQNVKWNQRLHALDAAEQSR